MSTSGTPFFPLSQQVPPSDPNAPPRLNLAALQGAIPASPMPALSARLPDVSAAPTQTQMDMAELNRVKNSGAGVDQIHNGFLKGVAKAADIVGSFVAPRLSALIPGTTLHHQVVLNQDSAKVGQDQAQDQSDAQTAATQAQAGYHNAQAAEAQAKAAAASPFTVTDEQAKAVGIPELAGVPLSAATYEKYFHTNQSDATKTSIADNNNTTSIANTQTKTDAAGDRNDATIASRESIAAAANKTRVLVKGMGDATSTANSMRTHPQGTDNGDGTVTPPKGGFKVPADVTKRAALASNVTENADEVDKLISRRPDIIGATGGQYTSVQQMIGSNDPDIAELGVRMRNIALASNGAHGVRAQGAIENTENELFNHFKSGPQAIHGALQATRGSMQTFLNDEQNFQTSGRRGGAPPPAPSGTVALSDGGQTYHIPAGMVNDFKKDHPNAR